MAILPYNFLTTPSRTNLSNSALNSRSNEDCLLSKDIGDYGHVFFTSLLSSFPTTRNASCKSRRLASNPISQYTNNASTRARVSWVNPKMSHTALSFSSGSSEAFMIPREYRSGHSILRSTCTLTPKRMCSTSVISLSKLVYLIITAWLRRRS